MSCYKIEIKDGHKVALPILSFDVFSGFRSDSRQLENLTMARKGDKKAKLRCLNIMYQGHPNDDGTVAGSKRLSRHFFFDIDDKQEAERVKALLVEDPQKYGAVMIETSISGGLHIVAHRPWAKTILESQCELALKLHCEMDTNNNDATRMCFSTSASADDLIYCSEDLFTDTFDAAKWEEEKSILDSLTEDVPEGAHSGNKHFKPWEHDWPSHGIHFTTGQTVVTLPPITTEQTDSQPFCTDFADNYEGILYRDIISKYWELYNGGNSPSEGGRNTLTFELAVNLAPLCDYNQQWLESITPKYDNFPTEEWQATIASALRQPKKGMPYRTRQVLQELRKEQKIKITGGTANTPPKMPTKLLPFHKALVACTPSVYVPTVCEGAFPALGTHLHEVTFRYIDGKVHEASFESVLIKDMSVGKGCIDKPIEYIQADIMESDRKNREREAEYKRNNPSGKKKSKRPTDICIQILMPDVTNAAFNQRLIDAANNGGRTLYIKVDEVEQLNKLRTDGTSVTSLMKLAWDRATVGQERVGSESVTGTAPCRWNFNASTTPSRGRAFFGPYVNDGTLSRLDLNTIDIPDGNDDIPVYKKYDNKYAESLAPYIERLNNASGEIRCKKAEDLARAMDKENKELAELYDSKAYKILSYRANVNAFKKGMILYILNDYKWTKDIESYVRWSLNWDLWIKLRYFGDLLDKAIKADELAVNPGPKNLLVQLPSSFTEEDLRKLRISEGKSGDITNLIRQWKFRGYIAYDDTIGRFIKIGKYAGQ